MSIIFEHVEKIYRHSDRNIVAVRDFELSVKRNEFVCIVGASGCGKSTILNLVAGFVFCDQGRIMYDGREIKKAGSDRTVVFQEDAVFPWMTVAQNIGYGLRLKKFPKEKQAAIISKYLKLVGLDDVADFFPKQLSGGMKKRVDLARAYANEPTTLLMDEPFGSLDVFTRHKMQQQLLELWELEKKTVLFVTHDIEEATFLGDRIAIMTPSPGKISKIIEIPFVRPRDRQIVKDDKFLSIKYEIERMIASDKTQ